MRTLTGLIASYTDDGTPKLRKFSSRKALERWAGQRALAHPQVTDGWWIDSIVDGKLEVVDDSIRIVMFTLECPVCKEPIDAVQEPDDGYDTPGAQLCDKADPKGCFKSYHDRCFSKHVCPVHPDPDTR